MSDIFKIRFFCVVMFVLFLGLLIIQLSQPLSYGKPYTYVETTHSSSTNDEMKITHYLYFYKNTILIQDSSNSLTSLGNFAITHESGYSKKLEMKIENDSWKEISKFNQFIIIDTIYNYDTWETEEVTYVCKDAIIEFVIYIIGILGSVIVFLCALTSKDDTYKKRIIIEK